MLAGSRLGRCFSGWQSPIRRKVPVKMCRLHGMQGSLERLRRYFGWRGFDDYNSENLWVLRVE